MYNNIDFLLQVIPQSITLFPETTYQPKLTKTPSMRAMTNYYNMPISDDKETNGNDNLAFLPEDVNRLPTSSPHPPDDYYSSFNGSNNTIGRENDFVFRSR